MNKDGVIQQLEQILGAPLSDDSKQIVEAIVTGTFAAGMQRADQIADLVHARSCDIANFTTQLFVQAGAET